MQAPRGGKAWVHIDYLLKKFDLVENFPGNYEGSYKVSTGDYVNKAKVLGYYENSKGQITEIKANEPLNILTSIFQVMVISPVSGEKVGQYFSIVGRTRPGSKVTLAPGVTFQSGGVKSPSQGQGGISQYADEEGNFNIYFGLPLRIKGLKFSFTIFAIDPLGNRSLPATFIVYVR